MVRSIFSGYHFFTPQGEKMIPKQLKLTGKRKLSRMAERQRDSTRASAR
jgi:hypothetical protein